MLEVVQEPVVRRELANRLIFERAVDLERVAELLQIALRGDEHPCDKKQQPRDDERPPRVDSEQRNWPRLERRALLLWSGLHRIGYRHGGAGYYRIPSWHCAPRPLRPPCPRQGSDPVGFVGSLARHSSAFAS